MREDAIGARGDATHLLRLDVDSFAVLQEIATVHELK
jgi:hypothetical protein